MDKNETWGMSQYFRNQDFDVSVEPTQEIPVIVPDSRATEIWNNFVTSRGMSHAPDTSTEITQPIDVAAVRLAVSQPELPSNDSLSLRDFLDPRNARTGPLINSKKATPILAVADISNNNTSKRTEAWKHKAKASVAAVMALSALALAACSNISASSKVNKKVSAVTLTKATVDPSCNTLTLSKEKPADLNNFAFLPPNNATNSKVAASVENSWFSTGPIGGHALQASIAAEQAFIADQAYSNKVANTQLDYSNQFTQDYNLMNGSNGKAQAETFCNDLNKVMGETESYDPNFAVKGNQLIWLRAVYNSQKDVVGVDPTRVTVTSNKLFSGIVFAPPIDAGKLGISGFDRVLVTSDGQEYLAGNLPTGGNTTNHSGKTGNVVSKQPQPSGSEANNQLASAPSNSQNTIIPTGGVANNGPSPERLPGNSNNGNSNNNKIGKKHQSKPGKLPTPSGGVTKTGPSPERLPGSGKGPSRGGKQPTPTNETVPTTIPSSTEVTTTTLPESTTTTTIPASTTTTTIPSTTTTTTPLKTADTGATANNVSGSGTSDPFNAGGSSTASNTGVSGNSGLAQ